MELLHSLEQIVHYTQLSDLAEELEKLSRKYNNTTLANLANTYQKEIEYELNLYRNYIGVECLAPPSSMSKSKEYRKGKIEGKFYFNSYSKSVRCTFRYNNGGFDTHAISQLKFI